MKIRLFAIVATLFIGQIEGMDSNKPNIDWQAWSPEIFIKSKAENKPVFLNLEAVWCHWCHVMDAKTYVDPKVVALLNDHYIAVKVDHDARPDLANRYRQYGWPATIIFHPDGHEIVKQAGFIDSESMIELLSAHKGHTPKSTLQLKPTMLSSSTVHKRLSPELKRLLHKRHKNSFDAELGGLRSSQKYLEADSVAYALLLAGRGDDSEAQRVQKTLSAATALIDPVWGGAYQYSTGGQWNRPHFEKLMRTQARYLNIYASAYQQFKHPEYLQVMNNIRRYITTFLTSSEGAFYVSQDADLIQGEKSHAYFASSNNERRKLGLPKVDTHIYADANGQAIEGYAAVYVATGDQSALAGALRALAYLEKYLVNSAGHFQHTQQDLSGRYLSDNLAMARAYLQLYKATNNEDYLRASLGLAKLIDQLFLYKNAGYASGVINNTPVMPLPQIDENISLGLFAASLYELTQNPVGKRIAERCLAYLANPAIAKKRFTEAGILLLEDALYP